jgi:hypothetical protein
MGLTHRPYIGTYVPNTRKIIQYTPDALVYLNGDTGMTGCRECSRQIDIQQFVTSVSVDAGTEPGAGSASISLSIPRHYGNSILRDGNTVLRNGLEVHIYFRGYFPMTGLATNDEDRGVDLPLSEVPQYPYYPVFHGVVTGVNHEYSGGYFTASLTCAGLLHFWQYMQVSSNGSYFGSRPENSGVRTNLRGHNLTGMTPYSIIYYLYRDTAGAAAGVGFALQSRSNYRASSTVTGDSVYSMTLRYWENRFAGGMYGLRMHGASGTLFTTAQQAFLSRLNSNQGRILSVASPTGGAGSRRAAVDSYIRTADSLNLIERRGNRILRGADLRFLSAANERDRAGVVVPQMQAFVNDISQYGQVNLFESTYESKLDIATQVTNVCGYEFYQDMDGDLVFKPPLYNLDTSSSRVYRIEVEDIISISFTENEPEATYCIVKGGVFQNLRGAVDEAEWGCRGTYIDYRLVAQFGWRESSIESNYYNNARSAYYAAITNLDRVNKGVNSCSLTIPLRPEIRPGYPVYIPSIDCFYYVESISHAFSFGSACTTTLNLVARRRKFFPPGRSNVSVEDIDLAQTSEAPRSFQYLDNSQQPRLLGFPNVVMALDPERINPLFYVVGFLAEEAALREESARAVRRRGETPANVNDLRDQFISNMIMVLVTPMAPGSPGPLLRATTESPATTPPTPGRGGRRGATSAPTVTEDPDSDDTSSERDRQLSGPWTLEGSEFEGRPPIYFDTLRNALRSILDVRSTARSRIRDVAEEIEVLERRLRDRILVLGNSATELPDEASVVDADASVVNIRNQVRALRADAELNYQFLNLEISTLAVTENDFLTTFFDRRGTRDLNLNFGRNGRGRTEEGTAESNAISNLRLLMFLFQQIRERNPSGATRDMDLDATGTINNTGLLLELIGDRKASLGLNTPGYYRYYSCSHPREEQQGYVALRETRRGDTTATTGGDSATRTVRETDTPTVAPSSTETDEVETVTTVRRLNATPEGFPAERQNEFVSLTDEVPVNGLRVRTFVDRNPTPTPTSEIFALSFEQRTSRRYGSRTVVRVRNPAQAIAALQQATSPNGGPIGSGLGNFLTQQVPESDRTSPTKTASQLVTQAVNGITSLNGPNGVALTAPAAPDINAGVPNDVANPPASDGGATLQALAGSAEATALRAKASDILSQKGQRLVYQVSKAYESVLTQAAQVIRSAGNPAEGTSERRERDRTLARLLRGWAGVIGRLFKNQGASNLPITFSTVSGVFEEALNQFSPVFPVSDALGYEHFGTYQYGRGLSIEPGGNYQRLMALDPFQYVDPTLVDSFVRRLIRAGGNRNAEAVRAVLTEVARGLESSGEPGADILIRRFSEISTSPTEDRTAMIASGMANYIFSDRDSVSKLPVSNAAFLLSDIRPTTGVADSCECRGAEADLILGALMVGTDTTTFVGVENSNTAAAQWTKEQMLVASDGWAAAQAAMRGQFDGRGRGSLFDSVQGWQGVGNQLVSIAEGLGNDLSPNSGSDLTNQLNLLNQTFEGISRPFNQSEE